MSGEIESKLTSEEIRERVTGELRILREWVSGWGIPYELITSEMFPNMAKYASRSLDMFQQIGAGSFKFDLEKLDIKDKYPEIWNWPDEKEKGFLLAAVKSGFGDEALKTLKEDYEKRLKNFGHKATGLF